MWHNMERERPSDPPPCLSMMIGPITKKALQSRSSTHNAALVELRKRQQGGEPSVPNRGPLPQAASPFFPTPPQSGFEQPP